MEAEMNAKLNKLIIKFQKEAQVSIKVADPIKLDGIFKARDELVNAVKLLNKASKTLDAIHTEYTLSLEPK
jgi:hypothetical protein